jgi:hypothetical protein
MTAFTLTEVAATFDVRKNTVTDCKEEGRVVANDHTRPVGAVLSLAMV